MGQVWFALFSGFSGQVRCLSRRCGRADLLQTLYDQWIITFFNAFFTFLPPLTFGLFEQDISPALIEKYPEAYREIQSGITYSPLTVLTWLTEAVWVSVVSFFGAFLLVRTALGGAGGRSDDLWTMGLLVSCAVIFGVQVLASSVPRFPA